MYNKPIVLTEPYNRRVATAVLRLFYYTTCYIIISILSKANEEDKHHNDIDNFMCSASYHNLACAYI